MDTSRDDVGIAIRSALLDKGTKQRFSLFALVILSAVFIFLDTFNTKPLNFFRSFVKDTIYRGSYVVSYPFKTIGNLAYYSQEHINLYKNYTELKFNKFN